MRNVHNAVSDAIVRLGVHTRLEEHTWLDPDNSNRHLVELIDRETRVVRMKLEIVQDDEEDILVCLLERQNVSRRAYERILDAIYDAVTDSSSAGSELNAR